jgi:hypothetical protein
MEKDPLRYHGGIKVSMAVAFNEGLQGLPQEMPKVRSFRDLHGIDKNPHLSK